MAATKEASIDQVTERRHESGSSSSAISPVSARTKRKKAIVSFTRLIYLLCLSEPQFFFSNDTAIERRPYGPVPIKILKLMKTISIDA